MHGVREVDHGRAARQAQDAALGREDVDLVREQVDAHALEELLRRPRLLHRDEVGEPLAGLGLALGHAAVARLVLPVGGDARLGDLVHVAGADLRLDRQAVRAEEGGVQRLVAVDARDGDVILEAPGHRPVGGVHHAERAVAGVGRVDDDPQAVDVHDLGERRALAQHLPVDAVEVLLAGLDLGGDAGGLQGTPQLLGDARQELALVAAGALERALEHAVALRVERAEAEVLELELHGVQAEPLGERGVDVERLARDGAAPLGRHRADGAHVVQAVGELDEDDAQVAHHREQHLAERFRLRLLAALELDLVELGDAVDDLRDVRPEARRELVLGDRRVFDDVVQDRRHDGVGVDAQLREDLGGGHRMGDVGLARLASLSAVGLGAELGGEADALDLLGRQVGGGAQQLLEAGGPAGARQEPEQRLRIVHGVSGGAAAPVSRRACCRTSPNPTRVR